MILLNQLITSHISDINSALCSNEFYELGDCTIAVMDRFLRGRKIEEKDLNPVFDACDELHSLGFRQLSFILHMIATGICRPENVTVPKSSECFECGEPSRYHDHTLN